MKISKTGLDLVKSFEGRRLTAYKCPAGVWTIGYGHTGKVDGKSINSGMKITSSKATELLKEDMAKFEKHVEGFRNKYDWNQNQFDAMVSFAFNVGSINQLTNNGKRTIKEISDKIPAYNKGGGKVLPGLTRRRRAEQDLFNTPVKKRKAIVRERAAFRSGTKTGKETFVRWLNPGIKVTVFKELTVGRTQWLQVGNGDSKGYVVRSKMEVR